MKAVPKVNMDGLYLDVELVDDAFSGVVPFYANQPEQTEEIEPELVGYIVGVPVPQGLFQPRFDLAAWERDSSLDSEDYWSEGLTPEEIEELTRPPEPELTPADFIAMDLVQKELEVLELKKQNTALGAQVVAQELASRDVATQYDALGKSLVVLELKLLEVTANKGGGE